MKIDGVGKVSGSHGGWCEGEKWQRRATERRHSQGGAPPVGGGSGGGGVGYAYGVLYLRLVNLFM